MVWLFRLFRKGGKIRRIYVCLHHDCDFKTEDKAKAIDHAAGGGGHDVVEVTEEDGDVICHMLEPGEGIGNMTEERDEEEEMMTDKEERA